MIALGIASFILTHSPAYLTETTFNAQEAQTLKQFERLLSANIKPVASITNFGVTETELMSISSAVTHKVTESNFDHSSTRSANQLVEMLCNAADTVLTKMVSPPSPRLAERERMEAILGWIRTHFQYNAALGSDKYPIELRRKYWHTKDLLSMDSPQCVCNGFARTALDLLQMAMKGTGTQIYLVNGSPRSFQPGIPVKVASTHSWIVAILPNGTPLFADLVKSNISLGQARVETQLHNPYCLPIGTMETDFFLATGYAMDMDGRKPLVEAVKFYNGTSEDWARFDGRQLWPKVRELLQLSNTAHLDHFPDIHH